MTVNPMHMANAFAGADTDQFDSATAELIRRREAVLAPSYRLFYQHPVVAARAEGVYIYDGEGNQYLDAYNNVPAVGHSHPHVQRLVAEQLGAVNTHTRYLTEPVLAYSERLLNLFPAQLNKVTYTCTGSEAVDLALRIARYHTGAEGIICTSHAYHGTTTAAAAVSPSLGPNNRLGPHIATVPVPDGRFVDAASTFAEGVQRAIAELSGGGVGFAGIIVDSILSSDGVWPNPIGLLHQAAQVVRDAGGLWIADEVQSGFGRLGTSWWGFERHGLMPDLVVLGKPMGNGLPIGAVIGQEDVITRFGRDIRYFNTFGGNPVCIAAATAVLDVIEADGLIANARQVGEALLHGLQKLAQIHPAIGGVRGSGLFLAVDLIDSSRAPDPATAARIVNNMREHRVLISVSGPFANVLKIRPPLPFTAEHGERLLEVLDSSLATHGADAP